jgi:uncharacterized protein YbaR (Trm112 family)
MRPVLLDLLACPICKHHPLQLKVEKEGPEEVMEGSLYCPRCDIDYPITDGIPNMIPPQPLWLRTAIKRQDR